MPCMKCGAKMKNSGVFCENCLADMEKYPVKSNITVHIPERPTDPPVRKRTRRVKYTKPEDQIRHLKRFATGSSACCWRLFWPLPALA